MEVELKTANELSMQLALELGVTPALVRKGISALGDRLTWIEGNPETRGRGPRFYGAEAVPLIRKWVEENKAAKLAKAHQAGPAGQFWLKIDRLQTAALTLGQLVQDVERVRKEILDLCERLYEQPMPIATSIRLLGQGLSVTAPLAVLVSPLHNVWSAAAVDVPFSAQGASPEAAIDALRHSLVSTYQRLNAAPHENRQLLHRLRQLIRSRED